MFASYDIGIIAAVLAASFGTAALALLLVARLTLAAARRQVLSAMLEGAGSAPVFLFDEELLADATPPARAMLEAAPAGESDWARLAALLRHRFPRLDLEIARLAEYGEIELAAADGSGDRLVAEWRAGFARLALTRAAGHSAEAEGGADRESLAATEAELAALRAVVRTGPAAIWKQDAEGTVLWANDVYFGLAEEFLGSEAAFSWPPPQLFGLASGGLSERGAAPIRVPLRADDGRPVRWFECQGYNEGPYLLCFATPADALIKAEEALREFVQTLSKTFAHLPIGLAIFDRARRLALFNPALTDLTSLDIEFLAARPSLFAFLDRLRDKRRIPEQRNYASWREHMADLEAAASGGFVQENWALPTGQTYRVTGRPHPDGAVAFLFEDISAEISLTRRFRSEIELGQSVIDSLDEAIAVFSAGGILSFANAAFVDLWGVDPTTTLTEVTMLEATRLWQSKSRPTPIWGDARDFVAEHGERAEWSGRFTLGDGRDVDCRFKPLSGGATLVGFTVQGNRDPAPARTAESVAVQPAPH